MRFTSSILLADETPTANQEDPAESASSCCQTPECCGRESGDCPCCFCRCGCDPLWTVRAGALFLQQSKPAGQTLVTAGFDPASTELINASDYHFDFHGGLDISVFRHTRVGDLELRYFGIDGWESALGPILSPGGGVMQFINPIGNVSYPSEITSLYRSELHNVEMNYRRQFTPRWQWLAGFRYLELDERSLGLTLDIGPGLNLAETDIRAANRLYGFQLGLDGVVWENGRRLRLEGFLKAGVYSNQMQTGSWLHQNVGLDYAAAATGNHTAFVGDLGLTAVVQITRHWSARLGYQVMWIEGVALASEQMLTTDLAAGTATVDATGSPFYHGVNFNLEYRW
ncbi:MAG: BBP7 family outer membrane beta-barrel protein [Pirellulales bacterium]|nr:BBP7 family outer membrane beta-barrel protein [Pirellulales bacterium]